MRLIVDLEEGATPISGRVTSEGEPPRPFVGYIQLIQELERAAAGNERVLTP